MTPKERVKILYNQILPFKEYLYSLKNQILNWYHLIK